MTLPELPPSLLSLAPHYDVVLCDIWGVLHDGGRAHASAVQALQAFRAAAKAVVLISNVPKPNGPIFEQLAQRGIDGTAFDAIVTSGDAIRAELIARAPGPMLKIGPAEFDASLWEDLPLKEAGLEEAAFIGVSGLTHPEETPEDYAPLLARAAERGLELVCANPDILVRVGKRLVWCAGALARDYEALGGRVVLAGKPFPPIYALAYQKVAEIVGRQIPKDRILAIGDGPLTDAKGANAEGLDCLFIAGGVNDPNQSGEGFSAQWATETLSKDGAFARYAMSALR
jgi:HAD superfamily hydrolase (TIGR01459 family)